MNAMDIVYKQVNYNNDAVKDGVIVRKDEIITYTHGPRDMGGASSFTIGEFLENPPDYVPSSVVGQVNNIVAGWSADEREKVSRQRRHVRNRLESEAKASKKATQESLANARRRKAIWELPDPWRGTPAEPAKPWWKIW